jgi:Na+-transporting NADH:ubiquinone oxidoreductase subunit C
MKFDINKSPAYVIFYAAAISLVFTAAIMALYQATLPTVKANQRLARDRALLELFGLAEADRLEEMSAEEIAGLVDRRIAGRLAAEGEAAEAGARREPIRITDPETGGTINLLVAFREDLPEGAEPAWRDGEKVLGYAFEVQGVGFWATIRGLLAVDAELERIIGLQILEHSETPGLGGRIAEEEFQEQFNPGGQPGGQEKLLLEPPPEGGQWIYISHATPSEGSRTWNRHVDAISGATGTSVAAEKFLNRDIARFYRAARAAGLTGTEAKDDSDGRRAGVDGVDSIRGAARVVSPRRGATLSGRGQSRRTGDTTAPPLRGGRTVASAPSQGSAPPEREFVRGGFRGLRPRLARVLPLRGSSLAAVPGLRGCRLAVVSALWLSPGSAEPLAIHGRRR